MNRITVDIPENTIGDWHVRRVTGDSSNIYSLAFDRPIGGPDGEPYGTYAFMTHTRNGRKHPVMQDTHLKYAEHQSLWDGATGHVLIGGLGIGFVNCKLIEMPHVLSVTIIENSQEVIDLVWPYCPKDERFSLVHADIDTWNPPEGSHWNYAWLDTWINNNSIKDHEEYIQMLHDRYHSFCDSLHFWRPL